MSGIQGILKETRGLVLGFSTVSYITQLHLCKLCRERVSSIQGEEGRKKKPKATEKEKAGTQPPYTNGSFKKPKFSLSYAW